MRLSQHSAFGLIFGTGLALSGATTSVGCGAKNFDNCAATRTCGSPAPSAGSGGGGAPGGGAGASAARAGSSGAVNGSGDRGGSGGKGGTGTGNDGGDSSGSGDRDSGGSGGKGGTGGGKGGNGGTSGTHPGADAGDSGVDAGSSMNDNGGDGTEPTHAGGRGSGGAPSSAGRAGGGGQAQGGAGGRAALAGSAGLGGLGGMAGHPAGDTTPPTILETSPQNQAIGVEEDAVITVTFSEPMNQTSVVYTSQDLPANSVGLSWSPDSTVLTIRPQSPLTYLDLTDPTASGKHYAFTIGASAKDLAGNAMGMDRTFGFSTLRHITQVLSVKSGGGVTFTEPSTSEIRCDKAGSYLAAGDNSDDDAILSMVAFDISSVPPGIVEWEGATLTGTLSYSGLNPYLDTRLGPLYLRSTTVSPSALSWSSVATEISVFAGYASQTDADVSVITPLTEDYAQRVARGNLTEYVFRFDTETNGDGAQSIARVLCSDLRLTLEYLAP
jgi:hypothetical protein